MSVNTEIERLQLRIDIGLAEVERIISDNTPSYSALFERAKPQLDLTNSNSVLKLEKTYRELVFKTKENHHTLCEGFKTYAAKIESAIARMTTKLTASPAAELPLGSARAEANGLQTTNKKGSSMSTNSTLAVRSTASYRPHFKIEQVHGSSKFNPEEREAHVPADIVMRSLGQLPQVFTGNHRPGLDQEQTIAYALSGLEQMVNNYSGVMTEEVRQKFEEVLIVIDEKLTTYCKSRESVAYGAPKKEIAAVAWRFNEQINSLREYLNKHQMAAESIRNLDTAYLELQYELDRYQKGHMPQREVGALLDRLGTIRETLLSPLILLAHNLPKDNPLRAALSHKNLAYMKDHQAMRKPLTTQWDTSLAKPAPTTEVFEKADADLREIETLKLNDLKLDEVDKWLAQLIKSHDTFVRDTQKVILVESISKDGKSHHLTYLTTREMQALRTRAPERIRTEQYDAFLQQPFRKYGYDAEYVGHVLAKEYPEDCHALKARFDQSLIALHTAFMDKLLDEADGICFVIETVDNNAERALDILHAVRENLNRPVREIGLNGDAQLIDKYRHVDQRIRNLFQTIICRRYEEIESNLVAFDNFHFGPLGERLPERLVNKSLQMLRDHRAELDKLLQIERTVEDTELRLTFNATHLHVVTSFDRLKGRLNEMQKVVPTREQALDALIHAAGNNDAAGETVWPEVVYDAIRKNYNALPADDQLMIRRHVMFGVLANRSINLTVEEIESLIRGEIQIPGTQGLLYEAFFNARAEMRQLDKMDGVAARPPAIEPALAPALPTDLTPAEILNALITITEDSGAKHINFENFKIFFLQLPSADQQTIFRHLRHLMEVEFGTVSNFTPSYLKKFLFGETLLVPESHDPVGRIHSALRSAQREIRKRRTIPNAPLREGLAPEQMRQTFDNLPIEDKHLLRKHMTRIAESIGVQVPSPDFVDKIITGEVVIAANKIDRFHLMEELYEAADKERLILGLANALEAAIAGPNQIDFARLEESYKQLPPAEQKMVRQELIRQMAGSGALRPYTNEACKRALLGQNEAVSDARIRRVIERAIVEIRNKYF